MGQLNKYGVLMVEFEIPNWNQLQKGMINEAHLYPEFGLETQPHVTILYGLTEEVTFEQIKPVLLPLSDIAVTFNKIDAFHLEDYDVLKFEAVSPELKFLHNMVATKYSNKSEYPYNSHMTIGYLNKGTVNNYVKNLNESFTLIPSNYCFSYANGERETLEI